LGNNFPLGLNNTRRLRRRLLLGLGAVLFVAGAVVLSIGLIGYFNEGDDPPPQQSIADLFPRSIDDVPKLPVAIPDYDPERTVAEPEPEPELSVPLRLVIESIGVDGPVVEMGMDDEGIPYVPLNGQDVAWYSFSSMPGAGSNAVFAGHVNWERAPGVFADLDDVQPGDTVRLLSDDGSGYTYEVFANFLVDPSNPDSLKVMAPTQADTITLITCSGTWIPDPSERFGGNYTDRAIVQARLIQSNMAAPAVPDATGGG